MLIKKLSIPGTDSAFLHSIGLRLPARPFSPRSTKKGSQSIGPDCLGSFENGRDLEADPGAKRDPAVPASATNDAKVRIGDIGAGPAGIGVVQQVADVGFELEVGALLQGGNEFPLLEDVEVEAPIGWDA